MWRGRVAGTTPTSSGAGREELGGSVANGHKRVNTDEWANRNKGGDGDERTHRDLDAHSPAHTCPNWFHHTPRDWANG